MKSAADNELETLLQTSLPRTNEDANPLQREDAARIKAEKLRKAREDLEKIRNERKLADRWEQVVETREIDPEEIEVPMWSEPEARPLERRRQTKKVARATTPIALPKKRIKREHILSKWPFLIWGFVLLIALLVHFGFVKETPAKGEVEKAIHVIAASEEGVITSFPASQWEEVTAGQPIATLASRKLEKSLAELDTRLAMRRVDSLALLQKEIEDLNNRMQEGAIELQGLEKEQKVLADQVTSLKSLTGNETDPPRVSQFIQQSTFAKDLAEVTPELIKVESKIAKELMAKEKNIGAISIREAELARLQTIEPLGIATLEEAQERKNLEAQLASLTINAPVAGSISVLHHSLGEKVEEGMPLLEIVEKPRSIEVAIPSSRFGETRVGSTIWIQRADNPDQTCESKVVRMASLFPNAGEFERDPLQEITVSYPENSGLLPGQTVHAYFENPDDSRLVVFWREVARSLH